MLLFILVAVCSGGITGSISAKANYFSNNVHGQIESGSNVIAFGTVNDSYNVVGLVSSTITNGYTSFEQDTSSDTGLVHQTDVTTLGNGLHSDSTGMIDIKKNIPTTLCDASQLVIDPTNTTAVTGQYPSSQNMEMSQTVIFNNGSFSSDVLADGIVTSMSGDLEADTGSHATNLRGSIIAGTSNSDTIPNIEIHEGRNTFAVSGANDPKIINEDGDIVGISSKQSIVWDFSEELANIAEVSESSSNLTETINETVNSTNGRI